MQTGYGADSVRSCDLRINCLRTSGVEGREREIHAMIRLTTSFGGVLGTMAGVEQLKDNLEQILLFDMIVVSFKLPDSEIY